MSSPDRIPLLIWRSAWLISPPALALLCWHEAWAPEIFSQTRALVWVGWGVLTIGSVGRAFTPRDAFPGWTAVCLVAPAVWAAWRVSGDRWQVGLVTIAALVCFAGAARALRIERSAQRAAAYLGLVFAVGALPAWSRYVLLELAGTGAGWLDSLSPFALIRDLHRPGDEVIALTTGQSWAVIGWSALAVLAALWMSRRRGPIMTAAALLILASPAAAQEVTSVRLLTGEVVRDGGLAWLGIELEGGAAAQRVEIVVRSSPRRSAHRSLVLGAEERRRVVMAMPVWRELPWLEVGLGEGGESTQRLELRFPAEQRRLGAVLRGPTSRPEPPELEALFERDAVVRLEAAALPLDQPILDGFDYVVVDGQDALFGSEAIARFVRLGGTLVRYGEHDPLPDLDRNAGAGRVIALDEVVADADVLGPARSLSCPGDLLRLAPPPRWGFGGFAGWVLFGTLVLGLCTYGLGRGGKPLALLVAVVAIVALELGVFRRVPVSSTRFTVVDLSPRASFSAADDFLALSRRAAGPVELTFAGPRPPIRVPFRRARLPELFERIEWSSDGDGGRVVAELPPGATALWVQRRLLHWPGALEWRDGEVTQLLEPSMRWHHLRLVRDSRWDPAGAREALAFQERWKLPLPSGRSAELEHSVLEEERRALARWAILPRLEISDARGGRGSLVLIAFSDPLAAWTGLDGNRYQSVRSLDTTWLVRLR